MRKRRNSTQYCDLRVFRRDCIIVVICAADRQTDASANTSSATAVCVIVVELRRRPLHV